MILNGIRLDRFFLLQRNEVFTLSHFFFFTANVSYGTLYWALSLVGMDSTAASIRALTKFFICLSV